MKYYIETTVSGSFEEIVERVTQELKKEGFGVLAKIEMHKTLKEKINVDFRNYTILEACNPPFAYKSLQAEKNIGIVLPCNVVVQEADNGNVDVAVVNPLVAMQAIKNEKMDEIAREIYEKLNRVKDNL